MFNFILGGNETSCFDECLGSGKGARQCAAECSGEDGKYLTKTFYAILTYVHYF